MKKLGIAAVLLFAACGEERGAAGDACLTSAECQAGLLCDTALASPVCALMGSPRPDLAGVDLFGLDLFGLDLAQSTADQSATLADMAKKD